VKKAAARDIPINHHVRDVLERLPRGLPDAPLFRYRGKPMKEWPRKSLENACKKAGILYGDDQMDGEQKGFCSRDIRPGVLSNMAAAEVGDRYMKYFAGHQQPDIMGKHYFEPINTRPEMDKFTAWLDAERERAKKFVVKSVVKTGNRPVARGTKTL